MEKVSLPKPGGGGDQLNFYVLIVTQETGYFESHRPKDIINVVTLTNISSSESQHKGIYLTLKCTWNVHTDISDHKENCSKMLITQAVLSAYNAGN